MKDELIQLPGESNAQFRARERKDMKMLIRAVLDSPIADGEVEEVDGNKPLRSFANKNTTVKTRLVIQAALDAANGDDKSRRFLMDYGGFMPPKEQSISVDVPQIIFDVAPDGESDCMTREAQPGFTYDEVDEEEEE